MLTIYKTITSMIQTPLKWLYQEWPSGDNPSMLEEKKQRLGNYPNGIIKNAPYDLWMHAASVGEVSAASAILRAVKKLMPEVKLILSVFTSAGYQRAMQELNDIAEIIFSPLDIPAAVGSAFQAIRPKVYAIIETELWPNTLLSAHKHGVKTILLNARISNRSFNHYLWLKPLFKPILNNLDWICAISETYKNRFIQLGANPHKIDITGNAKFEALLHKTDSNTPQGIRNLLRLDLNQPVFIAGSIRGGEEEQVMEAASLLKQAIPHLAIVLAPRHMNRVSTLKQAAAQANLSYLNLTDLIEKEKGNQNDQKRNNGILNSNPVIIVDVMGMLFNLYSIATVAFVGGSLVPKGGQNPMEPTAWACPVIFGPHMENFEEAKEALEKTGGAATVQNPTELAKLAKKIILTPSYRNEMGKKALNALKNLSQDSATRQAKHILRFLC